MKTFVVIPTKFQSRDTLIPLLKNLQEDYSVDKVYLLDNDRDDSFMRDGDWYYILGKVQMLDFYQHTIYEMWNHLIDYLGRVYPNESYNIAFLNDDIEIPKNTIGTLSHNLRMSLDLGIIYPDVAAYWNKEWPSSKIYALESGLANPFFEIEYTNTTAGAGGMTGYCFVMKGEVEVTVDENLKLYWGDDDLVKQVIARGWRIGKLVGLPINHVGSATINKMPREERYRLMEADRRYFNQKYNENRSPVF